jgi:hypothetical protein
VIDAEIQVWGGHAEGFARRHAAAALTALFARCLHLEAKGDVLCIGETGIGNGPLHARLATASWRRLLPELPPPGAPARLVAGRIEVGHTAFVTHGARRWHPPPWPRLPARGDLAAALERLAILAREQAPDEGLARPALGLPAAATPLADAALPRLRRLRSWTAARLRGERAAAPTDLLGLGPGLTPSGDDLLGGTLLALHAIARADAARDLHAALLRPAAGTTGSASRALLAAAATGQGFEAVHVLIIALLENRGIGRALLPLARIGHTSGWDALAGAVLVLEAAAHARG